MQRDDLARELFDRRDAVGEIATRMSGLAGDLHFHEHAALAAAHYITGRPPGLGIEHRARTPRLRLDDRATRGRANLFVRGEQPDQRRRRAAEFLEGSEHE